MNEQDSKKWLEDTFSKEELEDMVKVLGAYDHAYDYVGPDGCFRKVVPRKIYGCDINVCAYVHDYWYVKKGTKKDRFNADAAFLVDILTFIDGHDFGVFSFWRRNLSYRRAMTYYQAVRELGQNIWDT
jgi:hypothetical protein